ncbi:hypothetical protein GCM10007183_02740 [Staphylococcus muscae]|uniref:Uncharacterized protein n=1 Tax=Staphylococcus muscae TaxID=1294 RepID=A0ABQ1HMN4_9STAP|nr:hypothetical protein GCM10007183_02740 [Staphylococcus muscae]
MNEYDKGGVEEGEHFSTSYCFYSVNIQCLEGGKINNERTRLEKVRCLSDLSQVIQ